MPPLGENPVEDTWAPDRSAVVDAGSGVRMEVQWPLMLFLDSDCWLAAQWNPTHLSPNVGLREAPLTRVGRWLLC